MAATHKTDHWAGWRKEFPDSAVWVHTTGWRLEEGAPYYGRPWRVCRPDGSLLRDARANPRHFKTAANALIVANGAIVAASWKRKHK